MMHTTRGVETLSVACQGTTASWGSETRSPAQGGAAIEGSPMKNPRLSAAVALAAIFVVSVLILNRINDPEVPHSDNTNLRAEAGNIFVVPGIGVWEPVEGLRPVDNLLAIAFAPDGQAGVAIGSKGELVVTEDGGASWKIRSPITLSELSIATCITIPQSDRVLFGTVVDEDWPAATIYELKPSDGIQNKVWQGEFGGLLAATSNGRFWAGEDCFVLRADDTGFAPTRLPSCDGEVLYDIESDGSLVVAVGLNGLVSISHDEGTAWVTTRLKAAFNLESEPLEIHRVATNGVIALAGGNHGGLWRSEDAGLTWVLIRGLAKNVSVWALYLAPDGVTCFAAGGDQKGGYPFVTAANDGGKVFTPEPVRVARGRIMGIAQGKVGVFAVSFDGRVLVRRVAS